MKTYRPWLKNAKFDLSFILLPPLFAVAFCLFFSDRLDGTESIPLWAWLIFVLGIDVSHVYSTLFRTYWNSREFAERRALFSIVPLGAWLIGVLLYSASAGIFWRFMAYLAVFHFIRQQYGFLCLYTRGDPTTVVKKWIDSSLIYTATLYPIIYWHANQPRKFFWFINGDFFDGFPPILASAAGVIYLSLAILYCATEITSYRRGFGLNIPKNLLLFGTAASWYIGIVYFNGDMIFTITNIVAHGVPYIALIWLYGERQISAESPPKVLNRLDFRIFFSRYSAPLFIIVLLTLGYLEEGLWAGLVWREHLTAFTPFSHLPNVVSDDTLAWVVPLLSLPQVTHYILDGFIWKFRSTKSTWQDSIFTEKNCLPQNY